MAAGPATGHSWLTSLRGRILTGGLLWAVGALLLSVASDLDASDAWLALICLVALVLMAGGVLLLVLSLLPLGKLTGRLDPIRRGTVQQLRGEYPLEIQPLVDDLNVLLRRNREALRRSKVEADKLAHGLKTPLAILGNEIERLESGAESSTEEMRRQVEAMLAHAEVHLSRVRAAAARSVHPPAALVEVAPLIDGLVRTLERLHQARELSITADVETGAALEVDEEDLAEMLGNVLDNACKWAAKRIVIEVRREDDGGVSIAVEDDGPGLTPAEREDLMRGVRIAGTRDRSQGSGIGLSIVRSLAELYGGRFLARASSLGGLEVVLVFPSARQLADESPVSS